ncbi:MAG: hypothetical protein ACTHU0_27075 [Kofleriaceae bacterium]
MFALSMFSEARSAIQEIDALILALIGTVAFSGAGVIHHLMALKPAPQPKPSAPVPTIAPAAPQVPMVPTPPGGLA